MKKILVLATLFVMSLSTTTQAQFGIPSKSEASTKKKVKKKPKRE